MEIIDSLKSNSSTSANGITNISFGEYTKYYMLDRKCHYQRYVISEGRNLAPSYMSEYRKLYDKHVATDQRLCNKPISAITRGDLIRYRERIVEKLGVSSVARKVFKIVKQNIKYAATMGDIPHDPSAGMVDIKAEKKDRGILSMNEIGDIFPPNEIGPWLDDQDRLAFYLAYSCGLRKGEVLGLHWRNLDLEKGVVFIVEALHDIERKMGDPKKGKKRKAPLTKTSIEMLNAWRDKTKYPGNDDFVFCYQKRYRGLDPGHNFAGTWWNKRFHAAMEKLGIDTEGRNIVPHSLRHSLNTHLLDLGYSRDKLRDTFGWSDSSTQDIYTHSDMMDHSRQAELADEIPRMKMKKETEK